MIAAPSAAAPPRLPRYLEARWLAAAAGLFAFAMVLVLRGRAHPDEIFQYLEPAYRAVHGYGREAWEWRDGVRNWFAPGLLAIAIAALDALHIRGPHLQLAVIWAFGSAWHAFGMLALYRIIERRSGARAAAVGVLMLGTWLAYVLFAPR